MKVTLYSSDPLEDALRVVGALYGVSLQAGAPDAATPPVATPVARTRSRSRSAAAVTAPRKRASRAAVSTPTAELRRWAKEAGYQVNDRGPLPADVLAAHAASS
ncbi:MAG: Lsr2 family protein [Rhodoferax sp.]|nr:Lsr2 family protein [Actinomycetota bacterium]